MRTRVTLWVLAAILLCLAFFFGGRLSASHGVLTYSVKGWSTSFNRAWPTYGLPLAEDTSLLTSLREGRTTNAIPMLEALLDMALYDAMCRRPLLRGQERTKLDMALLKAARYRERFPRAIEETPRRGSGDAELLQRVENLIEEKKQIDSFLQGLLRN